MKAPSNRRFDPCISRNRRSEDRRRTGIRWLKFNAVGGIGIIVQLVALATFKGWLQLDYLWATALAVEAAVIHNFFWHERFTWFDRLSGKTGPNDSCMRFLKFNVSTGAFSIAGNLLLMYLLAGVAHLHYLVANIVTITACSIVNFLVSDRWVFEA
jgi:putative flippase GtrA